MIITGIIKWIHHPTSMLALKEELEDRYIEPEIPPKYSYHNMYKDWLKTHGVQFDGTISELGISLRL